MLLRPFTGVIFLHLLSHALELPIRFSAQSTDLQVQAARSNPFHSPARVDETETEHVGLRRKGGAQALAK
jgi:hypothetical protein